MSSEEKDQSLAYKFLYILFETIPSRGRIEDFEFATDLSMSVIRGNGLYIENSSHLNPIIYIDANKKYKNLVDKMIEIIKKARIGELVLYVERDNKIFVEIYGSDQSPALYIRLRNYQGSS